MSSARRQIIFTTVGLAGLVAFVITLFALPRYRPPPPEEARVADAVEPRSVRPDDNLQNPPELHLAAVSEALETAQAALRKASVRNKGGYVEKARADVEQAITDLGEALAYLQAHPEVGSQPVPPGPIDPTTVFATDHQDRPLPSTGTPNLRNALKALRNAWIELQSISSGSIGGRRDKLAKDIEQTASDTISAIEVAAGGG